MAKSERQNQSAMERNWDGKVTTTNLKCHFTLYFPGKHFLTCFLGGVGTGAGAGTGTGSGASTQKIW